MKAYNAMVTSDWSECLSPSGPFDMITFHHPHLRDEIDRIFRAYTGNAITMAQALARVGDLLPAPVSRAQLDAYLREGFAVYADVAAFMDWCRRNGVLFMINSTGAIGYFQRVFARGLLPSPDALAASPMVRFEATSSDPGIILPIMEISDKPRHSARVARRFDIPHHRIVVIGDSGGDGPHFQWGARTGATLVASLAKPSLLDYCRGHAIEIHMHWNPGRAGDAVNAAAGIPRLGVQGLIASIRNVLMGS